MNLNFQPFILFGQLKVSAKSRDNAETALFSAIKSKNLNVEVDDQGLIQFSNRYFLSSILRHDYFQGVKSGEIRLFVEPEDKINIRYKLFVAPIGWSMVITILFLILTLPLPPSSVSGSLIGDGISIVIGGLIFFMFWREYIRLNVKLFIRRTINH